MNGFTGIWTLYQQRFLTKGEWFYWGMDVLTAVGGSWLGLDGSMSARVQLAVGDSGLKPGGAVRRYSGCTEGSPLKGGTLEK